MDVRYWDLEDWALALGLLSVVCSAVGYGGQFVIWMLGY